MALSRRLLKELAERRCHVRVPRVMSALERGRVHRTLAGLWTLGSLAGAPPITATHHVRNR